MYKIITRSKDEEERIEPNNKISYISLSEAYAAPIIHPVAETIDNDIININITLDDFLD